MSRQRDSPSIAEYAEAQRQAGSCKEEFKNTMVKSFKVGLAVGVPFGYYVAYRNGCRNWRLVAGRPVFMTALTTTVMFGCLGFLGATYNCLRIA
uniref:HIG1 domain-containing protein n=1 Tax=Steinernema glaseri TaxID=37863 RepID=A0A1I8AJ50_9BILA